MSKIGILMTSRNNYDFMRGAWCSNVIDKCDGDMFEILNIDEDSSAEEKEKGKKLCSDYKNMTYMDREEPGMHHNIENAIKFFGSEVEYIIWFQHDCWPIQDNFFTEFSNFVKSGNLSQFGLICFNTLAQNFYRKDKESFDKLKKDFKDGKKPLGTLTRCHLESPVTGEYYYSGRKSKRIKHEVDKKLFSKPFACSEANFFCQAINVKNYKEFIDVDRPFHFFRSWDDISIQFLSNNIYNLVIPSLYMEHRPDKKRDYDLPYLSVRLANKGKNTYHSISGHKEKEWKKVWGWNRDKPETFEAVKNRYKGTLVYDFYKYDYRKGPLKVFDI